MNDKPQTMAERIDAIESAYEFMLAYAAQGRRATEGSASDEIRGYLMRFSAALDGLGEACAAEAGATNGTGSAAIARFRATLDADAERAGAALGLALSQPGISSQMIDNVNASSHVRTILTDIFMLDSVLPKVGAA